MPVRNKLAGIDPQQQQQHSGQERDYEAVRLPNGEAKQCA